MKKISLNQNWQFAKGTITMMELMMGEAGNIHEKVGDSGSVEGMYSCFGI